MNSILVRDCMNRNPLTLPAQLTVSEAIGTLLDAGLSGAPVVDEAKGLIGFVSEQDCIGKMLSCSYFDHEDDTVSDVMQKDVLTVSPHASILEVAEQMADDKPKNYPVVDHGRLVGLLTRSGILRELQRFMTAPHFRK